MFPLSLPYRLLLIIFLLISATVTGYIKGMSYQSMKDKVAASVLITANEKVVLDKEYQHGIDQGIINNLSTNIDERMRIHISTACTSTKDANKTSGILSNSVDKAFAELQAGVSRLIQECDQENIDAKQVTKD